jgi:hypothetical protein
MLAKSRRPREKRIFPLTRATNTIREFCDKTGLSEAAVLRSIDDGSLRVVKLGICRLILTRQPHTPGALKPDYPRSKDIPSRESGSALLVRKEQF